MRRVFGVCSESWVLCGQNGSPYGSVMSCQSLAAARAFADDKDLACGSFHRSVRFSSESRSSTRASTNCNDVECKRETPGSISLLTLSVSPGGGASQMPPIMSQSAPSATCDDDSPPPPPASCRFPKLEECAHFHYERVSLGGLSVALVPCEDSAADGHCATHAGDSAPSEGWICLKVRSHVNATAAGASGAGAADSEAVEWSLTRDAHNLLQLDDMLHRCIYDRKVSNLPDLSKEITETLVEDRVAYTRLIADYMHHLSMIADDSINCGPVLNWLQCDNKGHKLLVANEDCNSINTPAVAAAYSVRKYVSQARDEISFEVGDMISIIDMPGPNESLWWRGKRGFRVGFFPHHCVAVIGDKVPRHMTQPPPIVGSVAVAPIKPVLRKHGKLISLFRSFILSRPSRRSLKQQGILRERVFGCDLGEHLLNCEHEVPLVLVECARVIEERGAVDGIYRLSGGSGLTQRLRAAFDAGSAPDLTAQPVQRDPHALASLLKMYFRELPNPLCTYQLYEGFVFCVQGGGEEEEKLARMRQTVVKLPPPHYRTLAYLMRHLRRVSLLGSLTGMTARNMAIVWAPNLLRSPHAQHALQGVAVQAVVTEFLICYAEELFSGEQSSSAEQSPAERRAEPGAEPRVPEGRRPTSLPRAAPTQLLSLEEARRRGRGHNPPTIASPAALPPPSGVIAAAAGAQLRPSAHLRPKYIEVGSGPNNLPQYHTVLELPAPGTKRGLKRSPSGWRGLFSRSKQQRQRVARPLPSAPITPPTTLPIEFEQAIPRAGSNLRPVKSCESLQSESDTLAPLAERAVAAHKQHTRSASCDSYFEPWQAELADMRLRLSPQERDRNMFSEEDDGPPALSAQCDSICSSPGVSELCSVEPSPRRDLRVDIHAAQEAVERRLLKGQCTNGLFSVEMSPRRDLRVDIHAAQEAVERTRSAIEEQLANIGYIDGGESPRGKSSAEKRHSDGRARSPRDQGIAKRLCKDRKDSSPLGSLSDFQSSIVNVKLRERSSPRKAKNNPSRYSGMHQPLTNLPPDLTDRHVTVNYGAQSLPRLSWHGKDGHSTLIKIDWPLENSISNLTTSTLNSSPLTPITPLYDTLESDSEVSESHRHTINVEKGCDSCDKGTCLKCELKAAESPPKADFKIGHPVTGLIVPEQANLHDSLESPPHSTNISYQNLNRLSAISSSSNSDADKKKDGVEILTDRKSVMTSSHESSSSYSNPSKDELYEPYSFKRPNYINLQSSSTTSKSSPSTPLKSPLKSTISITFRSPTKSRESDYELIQNIETPTNERDSVYEDIDLDKNLSIVEDASVPEKDASLPTQQACQPEKYNQDLIILETPVEQRNFDDKDVYSQVKFFKKSIEEVNAMILESPEKEPSRHYENVPFPMARERKSNDYENITVDTLKICDKEDKSHDNGNSVKRQVNLNVRELANRFESPTEQKGPFTFEKFKAEIKYPTLERNEDKKEEIEPSTSPKTYKLSKSSNNARSLDENAFVQEFGSDTDRRKSMEVRELKKREKYLPDLNLNLNLDQKVTEVFEEITPTTENKISLIQRFDKPDLKTLIGFDAEKKLSRERIEKYKEERRNFLREKYSSQSFRSNPEHLTKIKIKKDEKELLSDAGDRTDQFERRNTVDLGQRMRFSLARSADELDSMDSADSLDFKEDEARCSRDFDRKEKVSPSYNIRDMAAMFEQKSQNNGTG